MRPFTDEERNGIIVDQIKINLLISKISRAIENKQLFLNDKEEREEVISYLNKAYNRIGG